MKIYGTIILELSEVQDHRVILPANTIESFMKPFLFIGLIVVHLTGFSQTRIYTTANAHSHNDYEKTNPFREAWKNGFGSIEADIFLDNGKLIVAHDKDQVKKRFTLDSLYLEPLQQCINKNNGYVYADKKRQLQLMIDLKTEAISTLKAVVDRLNNYPVLLKCSTLKITISGNRPPLTSFNVYPSWVLFDGELGNGYSKEQLERVPMFSDNFARYSSWKGEGDLPPNDLTSLQKMIDKAHALGKKIRFWNAPDNSNSWNTFMKLKVDYINTDHISELSRFLNL